MAVFLFLRSRGACRVHQAQVNSGWGRSMCRSIGPGLDAPCCMVGRRSASDWVRVSSTDNSMMLLQARLWNEHAILQVHFEPFW